MSFSGPVQLVFLVCGFLGLSKGPSFAQNRSYLPGRRNRRFGRLDRATVELGAVNERRSQLQHHITRSDAQRHARPAQRAGVTRAARSAVPSLKEREPYP